MRSVGKQQEIPFFNEVKPLKLLDISDCRDFQSVIYKSEREADVKRTYEIYAQDLGFANSGGFAKWRNGSLARMLDRLVVYMRLNGDYGLLQMLAEKSGLDIDAGDRAEQIKAKIKALQDELSEVA